jgi:hypothetical protein
LTFPRLFPSYPCSVYLTLFTLRNLVFLVSLSVVAVCCMKSALFAVVPLRCLLSNCGLLISWSSLYSLLHFLLLGWWVEAGSGAFNSWVPMSTGNAIDAIGASLAVEQSMYDFWNTNRLVLPHRSSPCSETLHRTIGVLSQFCMVAFALIFTAARLFSYGTCQLSDNLFFYSIDEGLPGSGPKSCLLPNEMLPGKSLI